LAVQAVLDEKASELRAVDDEIEMLRESIKKARHASVCAENSASLETSKVTMLDDITREMASHFPRLCASRESLAASLQCLLGDAMLVSAIITYAGAIDWTRKSEASKTWQNILKSHTICHSNDVSLVSFAQSCKQKRTVQPRGVVLDPVLQTALYACSMVCIHFLPFAHCMQGFLALSCDLQGWHLDPFLACTSEAQMT
jgi:hypothetical protein